MAVWDLNSNLDVFENVFEHYLAGLTKSDEVGDF
jgi:hypothetical protein